MIGFFAGILLASACFGLWLWADNVGAPRHQAQRIRTANLLIRLRLMPGETRSARAYRRGQEHRAAAEQAGLRDENGDVFIGTGLPNNRAGRRSFRKTKLARQLRG